MPYRQSLQDWKAARSRMQDAQPRQRTSTLESQLGAFVSSVLAPVLGALHDNT